jgi:hypothetical protein
MYKKPHVRNNPIVKRLLDAGVGGECPCNEQIAIPTDPVLTWSVRQIKAVGN